MNQPLPLVTCVIPCYNHQDYVQDAIHSVIAQDYDPIELIIINDGSKDATHEQILAVLPAARERFADVTYINQENIGLSASLNKSLAMAKGEFYTLLASDDRMLPTKVSALLSGFQQSSGSKPLACVFGDALFIDEHGQRQHIDRGGVLSPAGQFATFHQFYGRRHRLNQPTVTYPQVLAGNFIPAMSTLFLTRALRAVQGFDSTLRLEDWDIHLKLLREHDYLRLQQPVSEYRLHGANSIVTEKRRLLQDTVYLLERERSFCQQHGYFSVWQEKFFLTLIDLLKIKQYRFMLNSLRYPFSLMGFVAKKLAKKSTSPGE